MHIYTHSRETDGRARGAIYPRNERATHVNPPICPRPASQPLKPSCICRQADRRACFSDERRLFCVTGATSHGLYSRTCMRKFSRQQRPRFLCTRFISLIPIPDPELCADIHTHTQHTTHKESSPSHSSSTAPRAAPPNAPHPLPPSKKRHILKKTTAPTPPPPPTPQPPQYPPPPRQTPPRPPPRRGCGSTPRGTATDTPSSRG